MSGITGNVTNDRLVVVGPAGEATLVIKHMREVERDDDEPDCRDRVALELTFETTTPDNAKPAAYTVLHVYTRDSYDGQHRDVLEDSVVNEKLIAQVLAKVGRAAEAKDFVRGVAEWLPEFRPSIEVLLEQWDERNVPDGFPRDFVE
jgi:hypothetical protein